MHILQLPSEVLEVVASKLVATEPRGPIAGLLPFISCCKALYFTLAHPSSPSLKRYRREHHGAFAFGSVQLYAEICRAMFDTAAAARRLGPKSQTPRALADQLREWCLVLKIIAAGDVHDDRTEAVLWAAYLLMLENDGRNWEQLQWAGLRWFVDKYIRTRLWEDGEVHNGWPAENVPNSLAVWLMYMCSTEESLRIESEANRKQIERLLLPFVLLPCRYPSAHAPPNHFTFPVHEVCAKGLPTSVVTAHGPFPIYASLRGSDPGSGSAPVSSDHVSDKLHPKAVTNLLHWGVPIVLSPPLIAPAASLVFSQRKEQRRVEVAPHFARDRAEWESREVTRAVTEWEDANPRPTTSATAAWTTTRASVVQGAQLHASQNIVITKQDVLEWDAFKGAKPLPKTGFNWRKGFNADEEEEEQSTTLAKQVFHDHLVSPTTGVKSLKDSSLRWEQDWARISECWSPFVSKQPGTTYRPGSITGLWHGRSQIPPEEVYWRLLSTPQRPSEFDDSIAGNIMPASWPLFMRLREHHCISPNIPARTAMSNSAPSVNAPFGGAPAPIPAGPGSANPNPTLDEGQMNAWFSPTCRLEERDGHLLVGDDSRTGRISRYETDTAKEMHNPSTCRFCFQRSAATKEAERMRLAQRPRVEEALQAEMEIRRVRAEYALHSDEMDQDEEFMDYSDEEEEGGGYEDDEEDVEMEEGEAEHCQHEFDEVMHKINEREPAPCFGIEDTIITGKTDERHGQAWNHYTFYGRVRAWDGLICLVRVPRNPLTTESGRLVFTGNIIANQTLVGVWRKSGGAGPEYPGYSGAFVMSRRSD